MHTRKWKLFPEMEKIIPQKNLVSKNQECIWSRSLQMVNDLHCNIVLKIKTQVLIFLQAWEVNIEINMKWKQTFYRTIIIPPNRPILTQGHVRIVRSAKSPMAYDPNRPIDFTKGMLGSCAQFCFLLHNVRSYILCWTTLTLTQTKDQTRSFVF